MNHTHTHTHAHINSAYINFPFHLLQFLSRSHVILIGNHRFVYFSKLNRYKSISTILRKGNWLFSPCFFLFVFRSDAFQYASCPLSLYALYFISCFVQNTSKTPAIVIDNRYWCNLFSACLWFDMFLFPQFLYFNRNNKSDKSGACRLEEQEISTSYMVYYFLYCFQGSLAPIWLCEQYLFTAPLQF